MHNSSDISQKSSAFGFIAAVFIGAMLVWCATAIPASAAERVDELVSSGDKRLTAAGIGLYSVVGQASPLGRAASAGGTRLFSGNLIGSHGIGARSDLDSDGDGTDDVADQFPNDPYEDTDSDGDGTGNNADLDDDNDGTPDATDAFPLDPSENADSDGDGTGDNADAFPLDPTETNDNDGDGIGDNADLDDDNDGTPDTIDVWPLDPEKDSYDDVQVISIFHLLLF